MSEFRFLYWDNLGDSQDEVDKQKKDIHHSGYHTPCCNHQRELDDSEKEEEVMKLNHYTNLQPLWWYDNIKKRDSYSDNNYFDYFNNHQSSAEIYDDEEEQDIE